MKKHVYEIPVIVKVKAASYEEAITATSLVVRYGAVETAQNIPPKGYRDWWFPVLVHDEP